MLLLLLIFQQINFVKWHLIIDAHYNQFYLMAQRVKVIIRPKPLFKEQIKNYVNIDYSNGIISLNKPNDKIQASTGRDSFVRSFAFTKIFTPNSSQQEVYENSAFSIVENVLEGYNGTIFAYGQTGSGKTFTIMGGRQYMQRKAASKKAAYEHYDANEQNQFLSDLKGIIPRSFNQIVTRVNSQKDKKHLIQCYFIQIYNQNVHDLLGQDTKTKLALRENSSKGLVIEGLKTFLVKTVEDLQKYLRIGYRNRSVRQTTMNKQSSRSHCIFSIKIQEQTTDDFGNKKFKVGKLNLVDLAGSQRQSKTGIKEEGFKEATNINLSLSALGKVINCLSGYRQNQKIHIPYRDSKLTRILQDSLGGNTKTVMIATLSQNSINYEETLSTLIYASRAKFIQNRPVLNEDPKDVLLRQYVQQIQKLKMLLVQKEIENEGLRKSTVNFKLPALKRTEIQVINQLQESKFNEQYENNKIEQQQIKRKLENLENIVKKQGTQDEQQKKQLQKIDLLKKKIKLQQQRQVQLQKQKKMKEEQLQSIQKNYKDLNEEVYILRNRFSDLKEKYSSKEQQIEDFKREYNQQREDFSYVLKQKDRQIKKLEKLLETVLEEQTYRQIVKENESQSQEQSNLPSQSKIIPRLKVQNKAKVNLNQSNLFKSVSSQRHKQKPLEKGNSQIKAKINSQKNLVEARNYESQHQRKVKIASQISRTSTSMNILKAQKDKQRQKQRQKQREKARQRQKQQLRKATIKKVDSMISLKSVKRESSVKLPFITQVKKLSSPKKIQSESYNSEKSEYASKISLDIAKIKDEIINELKSKAKAR